jgi:predicted phage terminase large subunit-like protein
LGANSTIHADRIKSSDWFQRIVEHADATQDDASLDGILESVERSRAERGRRVAEAEEKERHRNAAADDLLEFILYTFPRYQAGWFHRRLCAALMWFESEVRAGNSPRLILEAPPRSGKTEVASRRFPVWYLGRNPDHEIVCASYNKDLADDNSRDARAIARNELAAEVFSTLAPVIHKNRYYGDYKRTDVDRVDNWKVGSGGSYKSAGVGTALAGRGAHVLIIDDPFKDRQEADSAARRELVKKWYTSTSMTRLSPGGGVIVMATRWHEQDLTGMLLDAAEHGGDQWVRLSFPAIAEEDEFEAGAPWDGLGEDEAGPPLLRRSGEALHPERFDIERLRKIEAAMHALGRGRDWDSLYQQRPIPESGNRIKREWFLERYDCDPHDITLQADEAWLTSDAAQKPGAQNDFHVMQVWSKTGEKRHLLDRVADQMDYPTYERTMNDLIAKWAPVLREKGGVLIEDTANGATYLQVCGPAVDGVPLIDVSPTRDTPGKDKGKPARANYLIRSGESRAIVLPSASRCPWVEDVIAWWCAFPLGTHDDDVDAASQLMMRWTLQTSDGESYFDMFG